MQQEQPEDFVIATGKQHTVREFVLLAAKELKMQLHFEGNGLHEKAYDSEGKCRVAVSERYFRPAEVDSLLGDATKAKQKLAWQPKVTFEELVTEMTQEDLKLAERDLLMKKSGYSILDYHE